MMDYTRTEDKLLDVQGVSLSFGDRVILRDVNATITDLERPDCAQGQVICFLGPSGIGKTQLSKIMAGLQAPTAGRVLLRGNVPTSPGHVGMVPQNYTLFEFLTVQENLKVAGRLLSPAERDHRLHDFAEALRFQDYLSLYPKALSGGSKQRVAIARQLMCAGNYLVMDEPFSGLDPIMKRKTTELIVKLAQSNTLMTIVLVTHDVSEGLSVSDTCWLMGYEKSGDAFLPGARVVEQHDLAQMGFAWQPDLSRNAAFLEFVAHIKDRFQTLR
jgi:ABC-type nitrate/sulfonate/bicarbonate transport system ATPase subunit